MVMSIGLGMRPCTCDKDTYCLRGNEITTSRDVQNANSHVGFWVLAVELRRSYGTSTASRLPASKTISSMSCGIPTVNFSIRSCLEDELAASGDCGTYCGRHACADDLRSLSKMVSLGHCKRFFGERSPVLVRPSCI